MPTTTNRGRAYIRRSRAIQWSSQRRNYQASTSPFQTKWGRPEGSARGDAAPSRSLGYCGTSRTTGPLTAGAAATGGAGCSVFWTSAGFPICPIGPYMIAITKMADAIIAPKMPATFSEFIAIFPGHVYDLISQKTVKLTWVSVQKTLIRMC